MAELVHSIREVGLLQPVVVPSASGDDRYELVMGERRWRASQQAGPGARSPRSCGRPTTTTCCATRCWRTCTAPSSTRWRRRRPTGSCSRTSAAPTRSSPSRIGRSRPQISNTLRLLKLSPGRPAPGRRRRAVGRPRPLAARGRGRRAPGPARRAGGRRGHQRARPRGDRRGRRAGGAAPARPRRSQADGARAGRARRAALATGSRPGSRSTSARPRAGSPSSSPRWTTCGGSST